MSTKNVLMLHGLGGNQASLTSVGFYCGERTVDTRFHAMEGPLNFGGDPDRSFGWFVPPDDTARSLDGPDRPSLDGIADSVAMIHGRIRELIDEGYDAGGIHLLGHSQGGAMALAAGLTFPDRLGSVCTISGYLALTPEMSVHASGTRYFLQHAEQDDNVNVRWAHYAQESIRTAGESCDLKCWSFQQDPHGIHPEQLNLICAVISAAGSLD